MSRQKISRLFAPCAAQSLRRFLISLSEEISPFVPFPAAGCGTNFPPPLAENPLVLWQTFFAAFAAAGDRLNLPNSRKSEVTYGLVPLMELAAHCGDLHGHYFLCRHFCRLLYRKASAPGQRCARCASDARAAADGRGLSAAARVRPQARHRRVGARNVRRQDGHDLVVGHLCHGGRHLPADVPHGARRVRVF